jgi:rod shape-determining protein MreD
MKLKAILVVAFALVLIGIQNGLLRFLGGGVFSLSLAIPCIVFLGLEDGSIESAVASAGVGYLLDVFAGGPKGLMTFLAVALFLMMRLVGAAIDVRGRTSFAVLSGVGTFLFGLGALLFLRVVSPPDLAPGYRLLPRLFLDGLLTGMVAPVIGLAMRWIDGLFKREETGLLS